MDIPAWLSDDNSSVDSGTENYILQQNFDDYHSALPCMEIGEIESFDGEWLA
ncbi:hypothetical protein DsansV1_C27g0201261 [Dioscorea sansibarensis]